MGQVASITPALQRPSEAFQWRIRWVGRGYVEEVALDVSALAGQHVSVVVPDVWLEARASSQALEPFFPFLSRGMGLGLLPDLGCC